MKRVTETAVRTWADPRLARLADGTATDAEREELSRAADEDPGLRHYLELFGPMGRDFEDELSRQALECVQGSRRRRRVHLLGWGALAPAVAAAAALLLWVPSEPGPPEGQLPTYHLEILGPVQRVRDDAAESEGRKRLDPGSQIEVVLRPEFAVRSEIQVFAWALRSGLPPRPISGEVDQAPSGAIRFRFQVDDAFGHWRGDGRLVVALGSASWPEPDVVGLGAGPWLRYDVDVRVGEGPGASEP